MPNPWTVPVSVRFDAKVDRSRGPDGCHLWTASINGAGYGQIGRGGRDGGTALAHRLAWEIARGAIPDRLQVLHRCDNKLCVNVAHLFLGTQADNMQDMAAKGRDNRAITNGEMNGLAKLTKRRVLAIRRAYAAGATQTRIAERFGVGQSTISSIVLRRTWQHV